MLEAVTNAFDKIVGTSKQTEPTAESPTNIDLEMAERVGREASNAGNAGNNGTRKLTSGAAQTKANANKSTAVDAQEEVASLKAMLTYYKDKLENIESECRLLRNNCKKLSDERDDQNNAREQCEAQRDLYVKVVRDILTHYLKPYASQHRMRPDRWTEQDINRVMRSLSRDASEAASLRAQIDGLNNEVNTLQEEVRALQTDMLSQVEKIRAVSDEEFAQDFRNIASLVKTLSREVRFTNQQDRLDILASGTLLFGISRNLWESRANMKSLTEAWFWSILCDNVFYSPFAILGQRCEVLSEVWASLFDTQHRHEWPSPTLLSETWRYTTIDQILEKTQQSNSETGKLRPQFKYLDKDIISIRNSILQALQTGLSDESSERNLPMMLQLADKAFALMSKMVFQRARLQVTFPTIGAHFDERTMMPLSNPNDDCVSGGIVSFVVSPGLTKWGDSHGKNLDYQYDIVPALVSVKPAGPTQESFSR